MARRKPGATYVKAPASVATPPEVVTEPFTVMLWGITSDSVANWLRSCGFGQALVGLPAGPLVAQAAPASSI